MRLIRVDKVFNNPYRVLGLFSPITSKELAKRSNDLETFIEFGKAKSYPLDMSTNEVELTRTVGSIQDATRSLESDNDRVFNSLFWFYQLDSVDEIAFEAIKGNNFVKAYDLWDSQILSSSKPKFSWLINANVLSFFEMESSGISHDKIYRVIERYGAVTKDLEGIKAGVLQSNKNIVDSTATSKKLVDSLIEFATDNRTSNSKGSSLELLGAFTSYQHDIQEYAQSKITNPYILEIEEVIKEVRERLNEDTSWIIYSLADQLKEKESLIRELDLYCSDYKVQKLINEYAETAMRCSVFAHNKLEESDFAKEIIDWASDLPAYGETKSDILDNQNKLDEIIEEASISKTFTNVLECLDKDIYSFADAQWLLSKMVIELKAINVYGEKEIETFKNLSGACVFKLINKALELYREGFDSFKQDPDIDMLNATITECHSLISRIQREFLYIEIDAEAQELIDKAYSHISAEQSDIQQIYQNAKKPKYLPATASEQKPLVGGVLYGVSNITGINLGYLRVGYVIVALVTGFWPLIALYAALTILKNFIENNVK